MIAVKHRSSAIAQAQSSRSTSSLSPICRCSSSSNPQASTVQHHWLCAATHNYRWEPIAFAPPGTHACCHPLPLFSREKSTKDPMETNVEDFFGSRTQIEVRGCCQSSLNFICCQNPSFSEKIDERSHVVNEGEVKAVVFIFAAL
uniref:Uncharacterized protein n=1 Tax=Nelumbo nucifera TaxID=4432 RepID=A0A822Z4N5_NELNU|nr:TPA_asm: hypothetical protein HUJ06_013836 [Nelumbo nucifera]